jgi:hypothetical protein
MRAGRLLDKRLRATRAVDEQSGDTSDNRAERQILDHLLVCSKA